MTTIVHVAGPAVVVLGTMTQRCSWCGCRLCSAQEGAVWALGTLVAVGDGPARAVGSAQGMELPENSCARTGYSAPDVPGGSDWSLLGMPICKNPNGEDDALAQPESALVIIKGFDHDGKVTWRARSTDGLTTVEALGMANFARKKLEDQM